MKGVKNVTIIEILKNKREELLKDTRIFDLNKINFILEEIERNPIIEDILYKFQEVMKHG